MSKEEKLLASEESAQRAISELKFAAKRYAKWADAEPEQEAMTFEELAKAAKSFAYHTRKRAYNNVMLTPQERFRGGMTRKMQLLADDPKAYEKLGKKAGLISQAKRRRCGCFGVWHLQTHPKCRYNPNGRKDKG